jgi:cation transport ATPase
MTNCPICNSKVDEKAKFCSECGVQLTEAPSERAWIIAMQERIKAAKHNDGIFNLLAVVGVIIAVAIPFVMRFVVHYTMDVWSWSLTAVGVVLLIGSILGMMNDSSNVKALIDELEQGPQYEEEEGEEEEEEKVEVKPVKKK